MACPICCCCFFFWGVVQFIFLLWRMRLNMSLSRLALTFHPPPQSLQSITSCRILTEQPWCWPVTAAYSFFPGSFGKWKEVHIWADGQGVSGISPNKKVNEKWGQAGYTASCRSDAISWTFLCFVTLQTSNYRWASKLKPTKNTEEIGQGEVMVLRCKIMSKP